MTSASLIDWLDSHAGSLTALATVVLCLITALYVMVTYLLLREQREQAREAEVIADVGELEDESVTLKVRNLGPGAALDLSVQAGPNHPLPSSIEIDELGAGVNLAAGESYNWYLRWSGTQPTCDVWLAANYFDRDRKQISIHAFIVRIDSSTAGTSAGWGDRFDSKDLRKLATRGLPWWKRSAYRRKFRGMTLHDLFVDPLVRMRLAEAVQGNLESVLEWEADYVKKLEEF